MADRENLRIAGPRDRRLMHDYQRLAKLAHQNRGRIPERTVRVKGSDFYGPLAIVPEFVQWPRPGAGNSVFLVASS